MDLRHYLALARRWSPLVIVSVLLAIVVAFVVTSFQPKVYEAKATLIVGQSLTGVNPDYTQLLASQSLSSTYAAVATTGQTAEAVIEKLGLDETPGQLLKHVAADAPTGSTLVTIAAQDPDPAQAAAIANAFAAELIASSPAINGQQDGLQASIDAQLDATLAQIDSTQARVDVLSSQATLTAAEVTELATLEGRLVSLRSTYATLLASSTTTASNVLSVIDPAVAPLSPVSPRLLLNVLIAAALGFVVAVGLAWVAHRLKDGVDDPEGIQQAAGLNTLGTVAQMRRDESRSEIYQLAALLHPRSSLAEAYRTLRTNIEFASLDAPLQTLLVTSAQAGEGKSVTAANLAVVFAQTGRRVLLVDADLRRPGAHLLFDLPNSHGLTTLLRTDDVTLETVAQPTELGGLRVLTSGPLPPNPAELLGSQRMRAIVERLVASEDLVIFDSPPIRAVADSAILSSFLDGTLIVVDAGRSRRRAVHQACESLARAGAHVLGAVLNRAPGPARSDYDDYYGTDAAPEDTTRRPAPATGAAATAADPSAHLPGTS